MADYPCKTFKAKDPSGVNVYRLDWSTWLTSHGSDTIASSSWVVPSGITEVTPANTTTTATIKVSGGTAGTDYDLKNTIVTAGGLTECRTIRVRVGER